MDVPWNDWQFYVVTLLAMCGAWVMVRPFLPRKGGSGSCPNCASGASARRKPRARLTIRGERS